MFNDTRGGANMPRTILRLPAVLKRRGVSRSAHYADIKAGLFVRPVKLGQRSQGTPDDEVDALVDATIAGKSADEMRALVARLEAARKAAKS
jgi:prophage regulatory protein